LYGIIPKDLLVASILSGWFLKGMIEIIFTPVMYLVIAKLKKVEQRDFYDRNTNFSPFIWK